MTEIKPIKIHILADKKEKIFLTKRIYNRKKLEENSDIQIEYINPKNEFDLLRKKRAQYDIRKNLHLRLRSETLDIDTKYLNLQKSPFSKKIYLKTPLLKVKAEMQHPKAFGGNIIDFTFKNQLIELLSIHGITQKNAQNLFESQVLWQYYTKHKKCRTSIIKYLQILNKEKCMIWNKIEMLTREKLVDFLEDAMILRSRCELYKRIGGKKCDELGWALHASGGNAGSFNMIALRFIEILKSHMPSFEHEDLSKIRMHSTMFKYSSYFSYLDEVAKEKKENSSDMSTTMGIAKFNKLLFKTHLMLEYRLVKSGIKQTAHINGYEYGVYYESCGHIPCSIAIKMLKQGFENTMTAEWINDMVIFGGIVAKGNEKENGIDDALLYVNNKTPENEINKNNNKVAVLLKKESLIWDMQL